jgi:hypothetical protein
MAYHTIKTEIIHEVSNNNVGGENEPPVYPPPPEREEEESSRLERDGRTTEPALEPCPRVLDSSNEPICSSS